MPTYTTNLNLVKPILTEAYDISVANGNADIIDTNIALKAPLASPTFTGTVSGITKTMVGLGNVDNTSDAAKPVSTAQQTALALKANLASPTFTGTVNGITKTMVGLGNVDNTTDANKPVSTATQTALDLKANLASPALTGTPTAPLANKNTDTTQIATTSFVQNQVRQLDHVVISTTQTLSNHFGKFVVVNTPSNITLTVPNDTTINYPAGTMIMLGRWGSGTVDIAPAAGVTLLSVSNKRNIANQYEVATLFKESANLWLLFGALS